MKLFINSPDDNQYSIMQRIFDGSLSIDSIDEFKEILNIYPDDPLLFRMYADLLSGKRKTSESAQAYDQAASLFIRQGMTLQAVVSKILQWSIQVASHDQGREFHSLLHSEGARHTPLQRFWAGMSYPQLVAVMRRLVRVRVESGYKIISCGDPADDIYFVVSGSLAEIPSPECQEEAFRTGVEIEQKIIGDNDIFGDIFPLNGPSFSRLDIQTVTHVELVKIAKPVLYDICTKYPQIEGLLRELYKAENRERCDRIWQTVRRTLRFGLPTKVELTIEPSRLKGESWKQIGIAQDISLGGMCADLGSLDSNNGRRRPFLKGRNVRLSLELLNETNLSLAGRIVWHREHITRKGSNHYVGIHFDSLSKSDREALEDYCKGSAGEQNLLWSLWDNLVRTDSVSE